MSATQRLDITVDLQNPAEFLACCGLLELAHRLWPGAEARFEGDGFELTAHADALSVPDILSALLEAPELVAMRVVPSKTSKREKPVEPTGNGTVEKDQVSGDTDDKGKVNPILLSGELNLRLDWWADKRGGGSAFKSWAGQQSSESIVAALTQEVGAALSKDGVDFFKHRLPLSGRFGFDPSSSWLALDVGWSPNEQKVEVGTAPAVELLAAIGLQRFRPMRASKDEFVYDYSAWNIFLNPPVAQAVCGGQWKPSGTRTYRFAIVKRGSYKGFERATKREATS